MSAEETLEQIKALLLDGNAITNAKHAELLGRLYDCVHLYHANLRHYEALFDRLQSEGKITPFPADWKQGQIGEAFSKAVDAEMELFNVMRQVDDLKG